jgi:hypothetical protein
MLIAVSKPKTEEQKEAIQARDRLNYVRNIKSKKGTGKISSMVVQSCSDHCQQ